ncbi:Cullin [Histoplasma capsulatum G186AR]|uniref:Cullin n=1 Tax=Ajellomyces capsulatus (strain G186AR / H82 / ATCC MYA-2454 / RMSCC 2432) TaxID=447093 RepID=C0NFH0_AJECG|nr:Cullin [Histoplasma capsulatum G186AR]EEH09991.1 Cullin [Histoplasma capsulatum G186AR]
MDGRDELDGLRGLYQDLSSLSRSALPNVDRLVFELENTIQDFRKLLDKPPKKRKIKLNDVEYAVNQQFQQDVLQVADALDVDEIEAASCYMQAQDDSKKLDRPPVMCTIIRFHERRSFLLECLRLVLFESFEVEREGTQAIMQEFVAKILEIQNGPLRNASLFARKCMDSMADIEKWLVRLGDLAQKASIVGQTQESDIEIIEYQRSSLGKEHESIGAILCYLFKGTFTSSEDFRLLLDRLRKLDKFDMSLVHYIPAIISSVSQYGSPEGSGSLRDARSLHQAIVPSKDPQDWVLAQFHAATTAFWLAEYTGWYFESGSGSPLQGISPEKEAADLSKLFITALDDGALEFMLQVCSGVSQNEWRDPGRIEMVNLLLKDSTPLTVEPDSSSPYFYALLMEHFEMFIESLIANMPDAIRTLKSEEDIQRLDQITALREGLTSNLHRGPIETRMHFETLLMIIAFAFEHRAEASQAFWTDPEGNLNGFLQWASKRQTVPRASAFCEMLCSISEGEENSLSAHKFLLDEDKISSTKFRRSASMSWIQMIDELQLYATKATERPSAAPPSVFRIRKLEPADIDEPESPVMLTSYLRLISHLCKQNSEIREWILQHPTLNLVNILLTLCDAPIPGHLRSSIFVTLRFLMVDRTSLHGNDMWIALDQWISGSGSQTSPIAKISLPTNSPGWNERHAFQKITETFDQTFSFVELLDTLASPPIDLANSQLSLPFPEPLGSSYRMPGIEPYIDFVIGQALVTRSVDIQEHQIRHLQLACFNFIVTCLENFNENLISIVSEHFVPLDSGMRSSSLNTYIRLHPFARVMEWLFNEDVLKAIFAAAHQNIDEVARATSDSIILRSLLRSIDVMNLIMDYQSTYFDVVRPLTKSQSRQSTINVANSSLTSFEDSVVNNLHIVTDLCLYCGTGHPQLTLTSLALLEKLSSSRKLNKATSSTLSRWQASNQIVELLNTDVEADRIARSLASQMKPDIRELESGPESSGYLIKLGLVNLLDRCLSINPEKPNMAHLLLGFSCLGKTLDVAVGSLFQDQMSLLHAIIEFAQSYPDGVDGTILAWMVHLKEASFRVLRYLWSSKLSSTLVLPELRYSRLLVSLFTTQPPVGPETLWNHFQTSDPEFWYSESPAALSGFLNYRSMLFDYAVTEIRSVSSHGAPSLQRDTLSTLLGSSVDENNRTFNHASFLDLFDFADLDIESIKPPPNLKFYNDVNLEPYTKTQGDGSLVLYDLATVKEFLDFTRQDLLQAGVATAQDEEQLLAERDNVLLFLHANNQSRRIRLNRYSAVQSWAELATTIIVTCEMDSGQRSMLILHILQVILPKLESSIVDTAAEAIELGRLAESLLEKLGSSPSTQIPNKGADIIDERLYHLFQACLRGIPLALENSPLRECLYNICSQYLSRITRDGSKHKRFGNHSEQVVKSSGSSLVEVSSSLLIDMIAQSNYLAMFVDVVGAIPSEFRNAPASDIDNPDALRKYYDLLLAVMRVIVSAVFARGLHNKQLLDQTRIFLSGNRQSMVGIFKRYAKVGGLDGGEVSETLEDLVKSYVALIDAVGFLQFEEEQSTESPPVISVWRFRPTTSKRHHPLSLPNTSNCISNRGVEMQNSIRPAPRGGNKSVGKRKHPEQEPEIREDQSRKQTTITDLFENGGNNISKNGRGELLPPSTKRVRRDISQPTSSLSTSDSTHQPISVEKMYTFPQNNTDSKSPTGGAGLNSSPKSNGATRQAGSRAFNYMTRPSNFTPHTGAKKLVVKNLRAIPRLDQDRYLEKVWSQLDSALTAVLADQKPEQSLEELYRGAENVCRQGNAAILAKRLQNRCEEHVSGTVLKVLLARAGECNDVDILRSVEEAWSAWNSRLVIIRSIFYYLDQSFLLHSADNPVIYEMGLIQFRTAIFSNDILRPRILQGACQLIELDRTEDNTVVDPNLLKRAIKLFHDLGVYKKHVEPCMLDASEKYISSWADRYLVSEHTNILIKEDDIVELLSKNDKFALEQLYSLLQRQDLGAKVKPAFSAYIIKEGSAIVFDQENEDKMVTRLLKFKENLDEIWKSAFHKNETLGHSLREAFEKFINETKQTGSNWGTDNPKPGEMIAKYVDMLLRGGVKAIQGLAEESKSGSTALVDEDAEINQKLDQVLDLFRFVHGKAVFEAFYKNDLARRLLMGRSASDEAEKSMLARLRSECGSNFTHNLESMFKDMDLARDEMASYNALLGPNRDRSNIDLNVNVISAAAWPSYPDVQLKIPKVISSAMDSFEQFYNNKYNGRKLHWKHSLAHCQLKAKFPKGNKEIVVSSFQAVVLLLFNDVEDDTTLSYPEIKEATGLSDIELKRTLQSLACAKYRVLTKRPKGRDVNDDDTFAFNPNFSDPKMRIKINQIQLKETKQENKTTHERVAADRHYETQAAIVRIMKARKVITHAELLVEVINKTKSRGVLEPAGIKTNIEK